MMHRYHDLEDFEIQQQCPSIVIENGAKVVWANGSWRENTGYGVAQSYRDMDDLTRQTWIVRYWQACHRRSCQAVSDLHTSIQSRLQKAQTDPMGFGLEARADLPKLRQLRAEMAHNARELARAQAALDQLQPVKPQNGHTNHVHEAARRALAELASLDPPIETDELTLSELEPSHD